MLCKQLNLQYFYLGLRRISKYTLESLFSGKTTGIIDVGILEAFHLIPFFIRSNLYFVIDGGGGSDSKYETTVLHKRVVFLFLENRPPECSDVCTRLQTPTNLVPHHLL